MPNPIAHPRWGRTGHREEGVVAGEYLLTTTDRAVLVGLCETLVAGLGLDKPRPSETTKTELPKKKKAKKKKKKAKKAT